MNVNSFKRRVEEKAEEARAEERERDEPRLEPAELPPVDPNTIADTEQRIAARRAKRLG